MKFLAVVLSALITVAGPAAAEGPSLVEAERTAIEAAIAGTLTTDVPADRLRVRLRANERTLERMVARDAELRTEIEGRLPKIDGLKRFLAANPGAMRAPRDQVQLMRLSQQNATTQQTLRTLAPTIERLTQAVAEDRARLLALSGGSAALERRRAALPRPR